MAVTEVPGDREEGHPSADRAAERWAALAEEISHTWNGGGGPQLAAGGAEPAAFSEAGVRDGSLLILGSGIQSIGFTVDAEAHIQSADKVFFCVADAVTVAWLRQLRPDAYDLYVLYDDTKPRYYTYIQMTEAMLHYVRRGQNVVGIYYGHPGIFVLSTHRAVRIAHREGYRAVMRAGISALDCLCADLGVDPAQPGLQTFEATDLLLRRRRLDPGLHVIIWQVGLIGEMGYRRRGFLNDNFPVFVGYLKSVYGPAYPVTHYVAARYPTMEPLIATHELGRLLDHKVRTTLSGLSTLYVPPRDGAPADLETAIALGLAQPGNVVRPSAPRREIDQYGRREMRAIAGFRGFAVPPDYQYQESTGASQFLIGLARDTGLQRRYASDPVQALAAYPGLTERERALLATRNEGAIQVAAKGKAVTDSPVEGLVHEALDRLTRARSLAAAVSRSRAERSDVPLRGWERDTGRSVDWRLLPAAIDNVLASSLRAWTGVYLEEASQCLLTVVGSRRGNRFSAVYAGGQRVPEFTFANRVLAWESGPGGASSGKFVFGYEPGSLRQATGYIDDGNGGRRVRLAEPALRGPAVAAWAGRYVTEAGRGLSVDITMDSGGLTVSVDGGRPARPELRDGTLSWDGNWLRIICPADGTARLTACLAGYGRPGGTLAGERADAFIAPYLGEYHARRSGTAEAPDLPLIVRADSLTVGTAAAQPYRFDAPWLRWGDGAPDTTSGELHAYIDPLTYRPCLSGTATWPGQAAELVHATGAGVSAPASPWTLRHAGSGPLPVWAAADLIALADRWANAGGLHLHAQWRKAFATHALLRRIAAALRLHRAD